MDRAAGDLDAGGDRIALGVSPGECREERRMDVDDPVRELADERRRDQAHEAREDDQPDLFVPKDFYEFAFEAFAVLAERAMIHDDRGDVRGFRAFEHRRPRDVADEDGEVDVQVSPLPRVHEALEVRASPRGEYSDPGSAHGGPSMFEQSDPREDHSDSVLVIGFDDLYITKRATRLSHRRDAAF